MLSSCPVIVLREGITNQEACGSCELELGTTVTYVGCDIETWFNSEWAHSGEP
jgi:hypothetical protein